MKNPYAPGRTEPLDRAFQPIMERVHANMPRRETRGDTIPIRGNVRMFQGEPGGRPGPQPPRLMEPLSSSSMKRKNFNIARRERTARERAILGARYLQKPVITLHQLGKPRAVDAALSSRMRPSVEIVGKPAAPAMIQGGYNRIPAENIARPKDTTLPMKPVEAWGMSRWGISSQMPLPPSSVVRLPKIR